MMTREFAWIAVVGFLSCAAAQAPPRPRRTAPRTPPATQIVVRDFSGSPLEGASVTITGPHAEQVETDAGGTARVTLPDGSYRFRFEHDGFVTLERDIAMKAGRPSEVDVALSAAPPPPPAPAPPAPAPAPPKPAAAPSGPPVNVSIPAFLEDNYIGRDPLKESVLGCTSDVTTRLLQLRDPMAAHTHADMDEILYVVAGNGTVRIQDRPTPMAAGELTVIPRGVSHAIEREGKNPLILLSTLAGQPCQAAPKDTPPASRK
jgi:mannose-6-phosphate isomerase-like protein (cupin superfamily)